MRKSHTCVHKHMDIMTWLMGPKVNVHAVLLAGLFTRHLESSQFTAAMTLLLGPITHSDQINKGDRREEKLIKSEQKVSQKCRVILTRTRLYSALLAALAPSCQFVRTSNPRPSYAKPSKVDSL